MFKHRTRKMKPEEREKIHYKAERIQREITKRERKQRKIAKKESH